MPESYLERAYALQSVADARELYDQWATSYDAEMADETHEYLSPSLASQHLARQLGDAVSDATILDAGCGTGLVGVHLAKAGAKSIDGIDLSQGMLDVARGTGAYGKLGVADLSKTLEIPDAAYSAAICVGTLTQGHVGPAALRELVRVTKAGGYVVATVLGSIWTQGGYETEVQRIVESGQATLVSAELENIVRGGDRKVRMVILRAR